MPSIMITGASGFIGSHVARAAAGRTAALTLMSHRRPPAVPRSAGVRTVTADLAAPHTLQGTCEGVDVLIHCASQIGGTPEANEAVNARGTEALVAEARRAGVSRIVHLSTASVYGRGTFIGARAEDLVRRPGSPTSQTRAAAEDTVLAAGGTVLRPHIVHGEGDVWVVPVIAGAMRALRHEVVGGEALLSVVSAAELARLLLGAALAPAGALSARVYHAVHPEPVSAARLLRAAADCAGLPPARRQLTVEQASEALVARGHTVTGLGMLATDHWFDGSRLWADLGEEPGPGFEEDFAGARAWYEDTVRAA
ncbi:NAD-dependent epimerase/dehydratase family protein [Streptomyces bambusae]|uniref:NAD-dependent epimerase/dehydratase family protein n=1 Tax=Streptomyces bambusae TaxID=1550616 RepID=UPI001CFFC627|nr:NAD-dependent epimerase/dehydratase family protein [Streptomyces bambusae]MCB5169620.1 NAD-dependent epimerase/dehydratase family protein [Streptomyces bambusae]